MIDTLQTVYLDRYEVKEETFYPYLLSFRKSYLGRYFIFEIFVNDNNNDNVKYFSSFSCKEYVDINFYL